MRSIIYSNKGIFIKIKNSILQYLSDNYNFLLLNYSYPARAAWLKSIRNIRKNISMVLQDVEAYNIYMILQRIYKIPWDIAEVGVYKWWSAKIIAEHKWDKKLHLFDTFEWLPSISDSDKNSQFHKGQFLSWFEQVKSHFTEYKDVFFYKWLFPDTATPIINNKFAFVNLDVDIYESTLQCLQFFYERMTKWWIILSHDYMTAQWVQKAFDEFFIDKPEVVLEMGWSQCLVVKI